MVEVLENVEVSMGVVFELFDLAYWLLKAIVHNMEMDWRLENVGLWRLWW